MQRPVLISTLVVSAALAACQTSPSDESPATPEEKGVELSIVQEGAPADGFCEVRIRTTYPTDMTLHKRELVVTQRDELVVSDAIELPRPEHDPRLVDNADGTTSFVFGGWGFGSCEDPVAKAPLHYEIKIGECVEGPCPPMTYVDNGTAPDISVTVAD